MTYSFHIEDFQSAEREWERLLQHSAVNSIFLTSYWQRTWWESMRLPGQELRLVRLTEGDTTIGIAPLLKSQGVLTFLGGTDLWDLHDFVIARGEEGTFFQALLDYLDSEEWREVRLESLEEGSPTLSYLLPLAAEKGYGVKREVEDSLMGVALPASWEEYLMGLRKKDRHELRRKLRRLDGQASFRVEGLRDVQEVAGAMDDFLHLMAQSRDEKSHFLTPERAAFFRDMALELARRGLLHLFFLEVEGVRTATTVCFDYNNVLSLYNSGHNTEYAALGTGFLLKALCLKRAICEGKRYFDLLRGSEQYKHHLGAVGRNLYCLSLLR